MHLVLLRKEQLPDATHLLSHPPHTCSSLGESYLPESPFIRLVPSPVSIQFLLPHLPPFTHNNPSTQHGILMVI